MSHVPHPPSGRFLHHWFPHMGPGDGSRAIGPPPGGSDATNMSHVPHPHSGRFLRSQFPNLGPVPKMAPLGGAEMGEGL